MHSTVKTGMQTRQGGREGVEKIGVKVPLGWKKSGKKRG